MSPALPREERDAPPPEQPHIISVVINGDRQSFRRGSFGYAMGQEIGRLSSALDAAEEENERLRADRRDVLAAVRPVMLVTDSLPGVVARVVAERDAARAEVADLMAANRHAVEAKLDALDREAALRGRIEGLATDLERPSAWPRGASAATVRALAADEGEATT